MPFNLQLLCLFLFSILPLVLTVRLVKEIDITAPPVVYGNKLYFGGTNGTHGYELWSSDGTSGGTSMVKDINPNDGSYPGSFIVVGETLYFTADDGNNGRELWRSTEVGVEMVMDINSTGDSDPGNFIVVGDTFYFTADNGNDGVEPWMIDDVTGA